MKYNIRAVGPAKRDIREVHRYIKDDLQSSAAAQRRLDLIHEKILGLETMPARYPLVPDEYLASKGIRVVAAKTHLVFFVIREHTQDELRRVFVLRVLYGRRDWARILTIDIEHPDRFNDVDFA